MFKTKKEKTDEINGVDKMTVSKMVTINKVNSFLKIYHDTFGQYPTSIVLPMEEIKQLQFEKHECSFFSDPLANLLQHKGVQLVPCRKEQLLKQKEELEELRKLKESLENIKSVLKV